MIGLPTATRPDPAGNLAHVMPHPVTEAGEDARKVMDLTLAYIADSITFAPRSLQKRIGPSEIGMPCDHCLAARLAGWTKIENGTPWLPFIGTCVHEHFERFFTNPANTENLIDCLTEARVTVGTIAGTPITGSTDLYIKHVDLQAGPGMTVDWKIVGNAKLDKVRAHQHPGAQYEAQAHLYAKGWNDAGHPTSHVCVQFLPRNKMTMGQGYTWIAPYQPDIAEAALARANQYATTIATLESLGEAVRDQWIKALPRDPDCFDCPKYPDFAARTSLDAALPIR